MVTDINNHAVIIYMYGFIARLFETLVRVFSYLQIQYTHVYERPGNTRL